MLKPSHEGERSQRNTRVPHALALRKYTGDFLTTGYFWSVQQGESYMGRKINSPRGRIEQREPHSEFSACGQQAEGHRSH